MASLDVSKPLVMLGDAVELLIHIEKMDGRMVSAPDALERDIVLADGKYSSEQYSIDGNLMTGDPAVDEYDDFIRVVAEHFSPSDVVEQAA